ncbi:MAG: hypothetical protein K5839_05000 [Treponemataceae bacterium]|nr:hypothetical protein [Treponemataceae bacterium]
MANFLDKVDEKAAAKGAFVKFLWQFFKFIIVSCMAMIIQLILVNVLYKAMKGIDTPLWPWLANIFNEGTMGVGHSNWGYVLPFLLSNLIANIYGYIQNKITTFKSDSPWWCMAIYIVLLVALILFSTWLQGIVNNACDKVDALRSYGPTLAGLTAGVLQFAVLFPVEKFVLLRERKPVEGEKSHIE